MNRVVILLGLIISSLVFSVAQELSQQKCDEYSWKSSFVSEPNEYRKYMDKFVIAKTLFRGYDAVLISENYALTSFPESSKLRFTDVIINNESISVSRQEQRENIYLIKLQVGVNLYHKIVCLWNVNDLPVGYNFFTVVHEIRGIPFLRTYVPNTDCPIVQLNSKRNRYNFCLDYENGRQFETVFENPTASSLIFFKSFNNNAGLNKNHYIMGMVQKSDVVYGRKLWPILRWIENVVWKGILGVPDALPLEHECGRATISLRKLAHPTEFPWQAALFEVMQQGSFNKNEFRCSGSLLNRDTVLTAANCIANFSTGELYEPSTHLIKLGVYDLDENYSSTQVIYVSTFIRPDSYNASAYYDDIGIIKLKNLVTYSSFVRPICLIGHILEFQKQEGVVAGWGSGESTRIPDILRKGTLRILSPNECRHNASDHIKEILIDVNYCAANREGQNVCSGDPGSGMIAEINYRWYLRGVVAFGDVVGGVCSPREFSLFTNTTKMYTWIMSKL